MIAERPLSGFGHRPFGPSPADRPGRAARKPYTGRERRAAGRARALLTAKLIVRDGAVSPDCVVRDLSIAGAHVRISRSIELPGNVGLLVVREGLLFDASVVWRMGEETGLRFSGQHDLHRDTDPRRLGVRALWKQLGPR